MFIGVTGYNHESSAALVDKNGVYDMSDVINSLKK